MMEAVRNGAWAKSGAPLPYLRRVAYLESHGTEWIDTGIVPALGNVYRVSFEIVRLEGFGAKTFNIFSGSSAYNKGTSLSADMSSFEGFRVANGGFLKETRILPEIGMRYKVIIHDFYFSINDKEFSIPVGPLEDINLYLFGANRNGSFQYATGAFIKVFEFSVDTKIKLIPVLDLSGSPAMYDEVSGQLFHNQGTGEFTWGELTE